MSYAIALTGSHCVGKTTLVEALKEKGFVVDERSLSREAQKALDWEDLSKAKESEKDMWELQEAILDAMKVQVSEINLSQVPTIVTRGPADIWAYTNLWTSKLDLQRGFESQPMLNRLLAYREECKILLLNYKEQIFVPIRKEIPYVAEKNRADEESRDRVDFLIQNFLFEEGNQRYRLSSLSVEDRVTEVSARVRAVKQ